jgi:peroxiredoxin
MKRILVLLLASAAVLAAQGPRRAPGFCLIDSAGQWQDLADYRGKPVLIEFMQTTCPHCAALSSVLNDLKSKFGDRIAILSVALPPDTPKSMLQFATAHKLSYPILLDQGQAAVSYVRAGTIEFPNLFLVDGNGMIRNHWEYSVLAKDIFEGNGLAREFEKLLAGGAKK